MSSRAKGFTAGLGLILFLMPGTGLAQVLHSQWFFDQGDLHATAVFELIGSNAARQLQVTLTNTATTKTYTNGILLSGLFFDVRDAQDALLTNLTRGTIGLTPGEGVYWSDELAPGDPLMDPALNPLTGHWAYRSGLNYTGVVGGKRGAPNQAYYGVGAAGLSGVTVTQGVFSKDDLYLTPSGQSNQPNGDDYAIVGDAITALNGANNTPIVSDSVTFTLGSLPSNVKIAGVYFAYGSAYPTDGGTGGGGEVPVPAAPVVVLIGGVVMGWCHRRYRKA